MTPPIYLVKGPDESLVRTEVVRLVDELVGHEDRGLVVSELEGDDYTLAAAVDAAQTPPFLTAKRVVVARDAKRFARADLVAPLVAYLAAPLDTSTVVVVWTGKGPSSAGRTDDADTEGDEATGGGRAIVPKALADAIKACGGEQVDTSPGGTTKAHQAWLHDQVARAAVKLDHAAVAALDEAVGEEAGRVAGILAALEGTFGVGARLGVDDVRPYLGEAGGVAPWDLTDAIDRGDIATSLDKLHRMLAGGGRHPLAVLATLHSHFQRMLALDGAGVGTEKQAAELLGLKGSSFPARKALEQGRRLGSTRLANAIGLLAQADRDLKGERDLPDDLTMEVLVARLANLGAAAR